jgi:DNA-binding NarL/FixJ family response regulator
MTTVLLVDDHALIRSGLAGLLDSTGDITVVGEAADGEQAIVAAQEHRPDVILMDLSMPVLDGVEATRRVLDLLPETKVVVLTSFSDRAQVDRALQAGAIGYVLKDSDPQDLVAAVRAAAAGHARSTLASRGHSCRPPPDPRRSTS